MNATSKRACNALPVSRRNLCLLSFCFLLFAFCFALSGADIKPYGGGHVKSFVEGQTKMVSRQAIGIEAGTSTQVLHGNAGGDPTWGSLSLSADVTGTLGAANGGIGLNSSGWSGFAKIDAGVWSAFDLFGTANIFTNLQTFYGVVTAAGVIPVNSTDDLGASNNPFDTVFADSLDSTGAAVGGGVVSTKVTGSETYHLFMLLNEGSMEWGPGTGTRDTTLSRTAASTLSLGAGDSLTVPGTLTVGTLAGYLKGTAGVVSAVSSIPVADISGNPVSGTGTSGYLAKFTGASTVGNSVMRESAGALHLDNDNDAALYVAETAGSALRLKAGSSAGYLYMTSNHPFYFGANGNQADMTISGGKVGIADTTPDATLDVGGTFQVDSTTTLGGALTLNAASTINGAMSFGNGHRLLLTDGTAGEPGIAFTGDTNTGIWRPSADVLSIATAGAGRVWVSQGVGIGTNGPTGMLDVRGEDDSTVVTVGIFGAQSGITATDTFVDFRSNSGSEGSIAGTASAGVIAYNTFTASHYSQILDLETIPAAARIGALIEIVPGNPVWPKKLRSQSITNVVAAHEEYVTNRVSVTNLIVNISTNYVPVTNTFPVVDAQGAAVLTPVYDYDATEQISTNNVVIYIRDGDSFRQTNQITRSTNLLTTVIGTNWSQFQHTEILQQPVVITNTTENTEWDCIITTNYFPAATNIIAARYHEAAAKSHLWKSRIARGIPANKRAIGVYLGTDKEGRDMVASIGTCIIWVSDDGGDIEVGDFLASSSTIGCAQRQPDDIQHNYTVGKATEIVAWANEGGKKRKRINCILVGD